MQKLGGGQYIQEECVSDLILERSRRAYSDESISKSDIFYYFYGMCHSPEMIETFKNSLEKDALRLPIVSSVADFWKFRDAGKSLGELHINYESVKPYEVEYLEGDPATRTLMPMAPEELYHLKKMKYGRSGDRSVVVYNDKITMINIPMDAYRYVLHGKPALEWITSQYRYKEDTSGRASTGIVDDPNQFATKTVGDPRYILDLFRRVITISIETLKIVDELPKLQLMNMDDFWN